MHEITTLSWNSIYQDGHLHKTVLAWFWKRILFACFSKLLYKSREVLYGFEINTFLSSEFLYVLHRLALNCSVYDYITCQYSSLGTNNLPEYIKKRRAHENACLCKVRRAQRFNNARRGIAETYIRRAQAFKLFLRVYVINLTCEALAYRKFNIQL